MLAFYIFFVCFRGAPFVSTRKVPWSLNTPVACAVCRALTTQTERCEKSRTLASVHRLLGPQWGASVLLSSLGDRVLCKCLILILDRRIKRRLKKDFNKMPLSRPQIISMVGFLFPFDKLEENNS